MVPRELQSKRPLEFSRGLVEVVGGGGVGGVILLALPQLNPLKNLNSRRSLGSNCALNSKPLRRPLATKVSAGCGVRNALCAALAPSAHAQRAPLLRHFD